MDTAVILASTYSDIHDAMRWIDKLNATGGKYLVARYNAHYWHIVKVAA